MDKEEIIEKLLSGEMKLYQIDKLTENATEALDIRREFIERHSNCKLDKIADYTLDMELAFAKNIENPIGTVQIPIGVAGPLKVNGEYAKDDFFVPLATSEGALLASVNRGCSAITAAGGANARVIGDKMTRAPAIKTDSIVEAVKVKQWFEEKFDELKEIAESTTSHGKLVKIDPIIIVGNYVYPRFVYSTGDSMGMNMVTIATEKVLAKLHEDLGVHALALSGNLCVDKKPAAINIVEGRGKTVVADILIPEAIVKTKLKTTAKAIEEVNIAKGSMAFNAHFANMIGAIFLATSQDEAHVVEGSLGITTAEDRDGDLYFSVNMPDLPIATIGGGTRLETANEGLRIIDCAGTGKVNKFAEIVISTVMAGELSLIAAISAGHLAKAHQELGR